MEQKIRFAFFTLIGLALLIQLIPYGRDHTNPEVKREPDWDRTRTRELFFRVCRDCHSNETRWPWYSSVAPASWLVQHDVEEGRSHFNVSEWGRAKNHGDEAAKEVREGEMPPWFYLPAHPEARLSEVERQDLLTGLIATFGEETSNGSDDHGDSHDDAQDG